MIHSITKTAGVVVGATVLATLSVNAIDTNGRAVTTYLGAALLGTEEQVGPCPAGMTVVENALVPYCVDMYEASPGSRCAYEEPDSNDETTLNLANSACVPESKPNATPWRYITQNEAKRACERAGKRLLTSDEWYKAAIGTGDSVTNADSEQCNIASNRADGVAKTGGGMRCVSDEGAYDMVGNVWEWVDGIVVKGVWDGNEVPETGYVRNVDVYGMPVETGSQPDEVFNHDRFWSNADMDAGLMRGGYYDSEDNAGVYTVYAASPPTFYGEGVGFRCATVIQRHDN